MSEFLKNKFWFSRIYNFEEKIRSSKNPVEMKEVKNKTQKCFFIKITESDWRLRVENYSNLIRLIRVKSLGKMILNQLQ